MDFEGRRYHLIGVGGVGMSALAQTLLDAGAVVSGSDRLLDSGGASSVFSVLRAAGVRLFPQNGEGVRSDLDAVIASTAVESGNADLEAAARRHIPVLHRAEMLARRVEGRRLIAVAGTAGKTTVAGMIGFLLEQLGFDPLVVNGGVVVNWDRSDRIGGARAGRGTWAVIEADESDRSLLRFSPTWAVLTNVSKDHFELEEVAALFRDFAGRAAEGIVADAAATATLGAASAGRRRRVEPPELTDFNSAPGGVGFRYRGRPARLAMAGRHNAENARLALAAVEAIGGETEAAVAALGRFRGIRRRLEVVGHINGATIVDDYAHNPAKIGASWSAVADGAKRVLGVWRPHGFGPLALMFEELADAFAAAMRADDRLYLLPVYYAGGTARGDRTSEELAAAVRGRGRAAAAVADYGELERTLRGDLCNGDAVLVMGARDPELPAFCRRLAGVAPDSGGNGQAGAPCSL